jgi:hypothetical protein
MKLHLFEWRVIFFVELIGLPLRRCGPHGWAQQLPVENEYG